MIQKEENTLTVSMLCEIANVARSGYYNWVASKKNRDLKDLVSNFYVVSTH